MKQFGTIFRFELGYYLRNKVFVRVTIFLMILIAAVMFFPRLSSLFAEEDPSGGEKAGAGPVMLVRADDPAQTETMRQVFAEAFPDYSVASDSGTDDEIREAVNSGEAACAVVLTGSTDYVCYVDNLSMYDATPEIVGSVLQDLARMNAMIESGLTPEQASDALGVRVTGEVVNLGKDQMQNFFYTYIMIIALYMVIILYGQMVATNVASEKSSRAMELLITSAKPTSMMFGKVLASCLAGLIQLVAVFGSALTFYSLNREYWGENPIVNSIFNIPPELLAYLLVFFVLGFLIYAFLFGAVGSTATKLEDVNTAIMPVTMLFIIAFFIVVFSMSSGNPDGTLMIVSSYVPFVSPMAMFTRIAMSEVAWYEIAASIAILVGSVVAVGVFSAKIYRVGVLLYGTKPGLGPILKNLRKS